ncbi:MAG: cytochrome c3 family protein [Nitrospinota bacterium]
MRKFLFYLFALGVMLLLIPFGGSAESQENLCLTCHSALKGRLGAPVEKWKKSIHEKARVFCQDCHGGDPLSLEKAKSPEAGFRGKLRPKEVPLVCGGCHSNVERMRQYNLRTDQLAEYKTSVHGRRLLEDGDERVATCASCHGAHEVRKKSDSLSPVFHTNVPETCGKCHADPELMKPYELPTDQLRDYRESYHGQILYGKIKGKNPLLAPNCATCHGIHGARPPGVKEVVNVCGNCHTVTAAYFKKSPHYLAVQAMGMPRCVDCHTNHLNKFPTLDMFQGDSPGHCGSCHSDSSSKGFQRAQAIAEDLGKARAGFQRASSSIQEVKDYGINVDELRERLSRAEKRLVEVGPITHSLDLARVKELMKLAEKETSQIVEASRKVREDVRRRKIAFSIVVVVIAIIITLLALKRRALKRALG